MKLGEWIAKMRILILLAGALLLIPSVIGIVGTRVNYDLLSYLPDSLETVRGQDLMVDEFGTGAFAMCVVEGMPMKEVQKLADEFDQIDHVKSVLWYGEVMDISIPTEILPDNIRSKFINGDAQLMVVFYDDTTSSDEAMSALTQMRRIAAGLLAAQYRGIDAFQALTEGARKGLGVLRDMVQLHRELQGGGSQSVTVCFVGETEEAAR